MRVAIAGNKTKRPGRGLFLVLAAVFGATQAYGAATSLALRSEPGGAHLFNGSQAVETVFGTSLAALPFSGTTTYHFYSLPMGEPVPLTTKSKGGGVVFMRNTAGSAANDFKVLGRIQYYDYDPTL